EKTSKMEAVANYAELLNKPGVKGAEVWAAAKKASPNLADDLCVHKPYIDEITYDSPFEEGSRMRRVPDVIDCWYDSGAMPFAQWGYQGEPHKAATSGRAERPTADDIPLMSKAELLEQVRSQQVREAERDRIYDEYKKQIGRIVSGVVQKNENGAVTVLLGDLEAILPLSEQIPGETLNPNDHV